MYGMINNAIKEMVIEKSDEKTWNEVCKTAGLEVNSFQSFEQYDDESTGALVFAIAQKMELAPPALLEAFGEFWVEYATKSEYQSILESFADGPVELIESLDSLHSRLEMTFEDLNAPSFWVTKVSEKEVKVHYVTTRDMPLEYFVIGLIKGIFSMFDQTCEVKLLEPETNEKAIFQVTF
jgi:hypothetical protein